MISDYRDVTVYHHRAWTEYLLLASLPGARPLEVVIGETAADVLARLAPRVPRSCSTSTRPIPSACRSIAPR
jgi:hypothetical protein